MANALPSDCLIVIFGASGDLTKRKLIPALYYLWDNDLAPKNFAVLGVSRTKYSDDEFRDGLYDFGKKEYDEAKWRECSRTINLALTARYELWNGILDVIKGTG